MGTEYIDREVKRQGIIVRPSVARELTLDELTKGSTPKVAAWLTNDYYLAHPRELNFKVRKERERERGKGKHNKEVKPRLLPPPRTGTLADKKKRMLKYIEAKYGGKVNDK